MAALYSCYTQDTLYQCLPIGSNLKEEATYSDFKEVVVALSLKMPANFHELYKQLCIIKPALSVYLNDKYKRTLSVNNM
jgi:hypothetical protein